MSDRCARRASTALRRDPLPADREIAALVHRLEELPDDGSDEQLAVLRSLQRVATARARAASDATRAEA